MKKMIIGSVLVLTTAFAASASAAGLLQFQINGKTQGAALQAKNENGTTFVAARAFAEAMGAQVRWNGETGTVSVDLPPSNDPGYTSQLEKALAPATAQEAAELWAKGVKTRNGALQYAVASPELRAQLRPDFDAFHWVTGTSSPWVDSYKIVPAKDGTDGKQSFAVTFVWTESAGSKTETTDTISTTKIDGNWCVQSIANRPAFNYDGINYENPYHAYKLTLPKSWLDRYTIAGDDKMTSFVFKDSVQTQQPIVTVWSVPAAGFKADDYGRVEKLGEQDGILYFYSRPFDNPFSGDVANAYAQMTKEGFDAMKSFELPPKHGK